MLTAELLTCGPGRGMIAEGLELKEREQRSRERPSTVCFYLLCARHHQAQPAASPGGHLVPDIAVGYVHYPKIHLRIKSTCS